MDKHGRAQRGNVHPALARSACRLATQGRDSKEAEQLEGMQGVSTLWPAGRTEAPSPSWQPALSLEPRSVRGSVRKGAAKLSQKALPPKCSPPSSCREKSPTRLLAPIAPHAGCQYPASTGSSSSRAGELQRSEATVAAPRIKLPCRPPRPTPAPRRRAGPAVRPAGSAELSSAGGARRAARGGRSPRFRPPGGWIRPRSGFPARTACRRSRSRSGSDLGRRRRGSCVIFRGNLI